MNLTMEWMQNRGAHIPLACAFKPAIEVQCAYKTEFAKVNPSSAWGPHRVTMCWVLSCDGPPTERNSKRHREALPVAGAPQAGPWSWGTGYWGADAASSSSATTQRCSVTGFLSPRCFLQKSDLVEAWTTAVREGKDAGVWQATVGYMELEPERRRDSQKRSIEEKGSYCNYWCYH